MQSPYIGTIGQLNFWRSRRSSLRHQSSLYTFPTTSQAPCPWSNPMWQPELVAMPAISVSSSTIAGKQIPPATAFPIQIHTYIHILWIKIKKRRHRGPHPILAPGTCIHTRLVMSHHQIWQYIYIHTYTYIYIHTHTYIHTYVSVKANRYCKIWMWDTPWPVWIHTCIHAPCDSPG